MYLFIYTHTHAHTHKTYICMHAINMHAPPRAVRRIGTECRAYAPAARPPQTPPVRPRRAHVAAVRAGPSE